MSTANIMKSSTLRAGFVGGGFMAEVHSRAVRAAFGSPVAVVTSTPSSAARASERLGLGTAYDSLEQLLADDSVDVIHICSPNTTHARFATLALTAGKHVICEKPLATSVADAEALVSLATRSGLVAAVPFVYRFHPMVREARARVLSGEVGTVFSIQGQYLQDWLLSHDDDNWRVDEASGGSSRAFADIGSHLCDLIEFILNDRIKNLSAVTRTVFSERRSNKNIQTEDIAAILFETHLGAVGTLLISQVAPGRKNRLTVEISGHDKSLSFDQENPEQLWIGSRNESQVLVRDPATNHESAARLSVLPSGHVQGYQDAFNGFIADAYTAIRTGTVPEGMPQFADGLRAAQLTSAVQRSARERTWQQIPD